MFICNVIEKMFIIFYLKPNYIHTYNLSKYTSLQSSGSIIVPMNLTGWQAVINIKFEHNKRWARLNIRNDIYHLWFFSPIQQLNL